MADIIEEILKEADRINESVEMSSIQHFIAAKSWRRAHFILGIIATIAATISTALIFSPKHPYPCRIASGHGRDNLGTTYFPKSQTTCGYAS